MNNHTLKTSTNHLFTVETQSFSNNQISSQITHAGKTFTFSFISRKRKTPFDFGDSMTFTCPPEAKLWLYLHNYSVIMTAAFPVKVMATW